jgi:hypothetical protein
METESYAVRSRPTNPCDPKSVEGCAFQVLMDMAAYIVPVSREAVCVEAQALYVERNRDYVDPATGRRGRYTMLSSVDRMIRGGDDSMLATKLAAQGWILGCPRFDGKHKQGFVMLWRQPAGPRFPAIDTESGGG